MTEISLAVPGLVLLVGPTGAGKSTFAAKWFASDEVVSLDACRILVSGDVNDQSSTRDAVAVASAIVEARLSRRLLTVVDATNFRNEDRRR